MVRMEIFDNQIPVFGQADDRTLNQIRVCARTADKVALKPELGYSRLREEPIQVVSVRITQRFTGHGGVRLI